MTKSRLEWYGDKVAIDARRRLMDMILALAAEAAEDAKSEVPVQDGELRDSIQVQVTSDGAVVSAGAEHAPYVEIGTRYQPAQPFMGPAFARLLANWRRRIK